MEDIQINDVTLKPIEQSNFLKPLMVNFTQNDKKRSSNFFKSHDSVACILFNTSRNVLVMVKQFRPPVYLYAARQLSSGNEDYDAVDWTKVPAKCGVTTELVAGIVDKNTSLEDIVKSEVLEESGYDVPLENFQKVISCPNVGKLSTGNMFYAECTDEMKVAEGGGIAEEGEQIDVVEMTIPQVREYISQETVLSSAGFMFGIMWFLVNKAPKDC